MFDCNVELKSSSVCHAPGIGGLEGLPDSGGVHVEVCEATTMSGPIDRGIDVREGEEEYSLSLLGV